MTLALILLYALAGLALSFPFASALERELAGKRMDAEDILVIAVLAIFWPLVLIAAGWWCAYRAYSRWQTESKLRRLGATTEEDKHRG